MSSTSPPSKRPRLSSPSPPPKQPKREPPSALAQDVLDVAEEDNGDCAICLQPIQDRTVLPCAHDVFCWECILLWVEHSRKCPLCTHAIDHLIHNIRFVRAKERALVPNAHPLPRSPYDYQKHFLPPLPSSSPSRPIAAQQRRQIQSRRNREWGRPRREREADELERAVQRRRWIYRNGLYAKHVASNPYTRYKPGPSPSQFAASSSDISRTAAFLRRELRVWPALDVEFLTTFILSLMRSLDIRSEASVKLLAEFLDMDEGGRKNAEHFAHEVYSYLRSPYRSLIIYDTVVQYDSPAGLSPTFPPKMPSKYRSPSPPPLKSPYNDEPYDSRADTTSKPYGLRPDRDNHTAHTAVPASRTERNAQGSRQACS
ncbi:hypothetical protein CALVIDRAFT_356967 [Calocera viscosa TUFC12733]|uniref:RING-type E3 ubiquitin transferase n=1 Tax=Calocera viscosa (strain TUFC12733) TaxID=1330018 RepID=A0A167QEJ8_CALVF|nr:hypothetical protein CALVIDRAFT_356967 [Calocera viscosa TUFC12733]